MKQLSDLTKASQLVRGRTEEEKQHPPRSSSLITPVCLFPSQHNGAVASTQPGVNALMCVRCVMVYSARGPCSQVCSVNRVRDALTWAVPVSRATLNKH